VVQDTPGILKIDVNFYKNMFRKEDRASVSLIDVFWDPEN
jgi:hypothetical protein